MRIVVCVKEVLDPDAVNNYVLSGNLKIGSDGKTPEVSAIPQLMNGFDEQAMEAALRIRDSGVDCTIVALTVGSERTSMLKHCAALGADEIVSIDPQGREMDTHSIAAVIAAYVKKNGGADLILCGRQASDDDQGVVPLLVAEQLAYPVVPFARALVINGDNLTVTRATPDGDEVVEGSFPAVVTISNELGDPRFPTAKAKMLARKKAPLVVSLSELELKDSEVKPRVLLKKQYVPDVQGNCEFLEGSASEVAQLLLSKLRADRLL